MITARKKMLVRTVFAAALSGCTVNSNQTEKTGGVDGSGGDAAHSTTADVEKEVADLKLNLKRAFHRIAVIQKEEAGSEFTYEDPLTWNIPPEISVYLPRNWDTKQLFEKIDAAEFKVIDKPCFENGVQKEAAVVSPREICFSGTLLTRIPREALPLQMLALGGHEIGHLVGLSEEAVQRMQQWIIDNPKLLGNHQQDFYQTLWNLGEVVGTGTETLIGNILERSDPRDIHVAVRKLADNFHKAYTSPIGYWCFSHRMMKEGSEIWRDIYFKMGSYKNDPVAYVSKDGLYTGLQGLTRDLQLVIERMIGLGTMIDRFSNVDNNDVWPGLEQWDSLDLRRLKNSFPVLNSAPIVAEPIDLSEVRCSISDSEGQILSQMKVSDGATSPTNSNVKIVEFLLPDSTGANRPVFANFLWSEVFGTHELGVLDVGVDTNTYEAPFGPIIPTNFKSLSFHQLDGVELWGFKDKWGVATILQKKLLESFSFSFGIKPQGTTATVPAQYTFTCKIN